MNEVQREPREPICPGGIIQWNPTLKAVINPTRENRGIFFEHKDFVHHCTMYCKKTYACKEQKEKWKKEILDIFKNYGKEIIEPVPEHVIDN